LKSTFENTLISTSKTLLPTFSLLGIFRTQFLAYVIGLNDTISHKVFIQEDEMLNAEATMNFLRKLEGGYPTKTKIHLFCDNARYYRNKAVTHYLRTSKIQLHFLSPYSPNLNPIERLWKWMKERVIYNTYYREFEDFKSAVFGFFAVLSTLEAESVLGQCFRSRVRDKFRPFGSPAV
jgi:transposase